MDGHNMKNRKAYKLGPYRITVPGDWEEVENDVFDDMRNLLFSFWETDQKESMASANWLLIDALSDDVKKKLPDVLTVEEVLPLFHSDKEITVLSVEDIKGIRMAFCREANGILEGVSASFVEGRALTMLNVHVAEGGLKRAGTLLSEILDSLVRISE